MSTYRVGLLGATGETGGSILDALIRDQDFAVVAFARSSSLAKPANIELRAKGLEMRALDLDGPEDTMVAALADLDIMISAIGPRDQLAQLPLVAAAKKADVKRFIPCGFQPIVPLGVHQSRDQKEEVYRLITDLKLPYTIIDVGWWYQFSLPSLPSGKIDYAVSAAMQSIPGEGNVLSARTDLRDVGKYIARVLKDERTLDKKVFVYNEMWSASQVYDVLEEMSGESIERKYTSADEYKAIISDAVLTLEHDPTSAAARGRKVLAEYALAWGIRGENTPEMAEKLGYLDGKSLYPDFCFVAFRTYVGEVLDGRARAVYRDQ